MATRNIVPRANGEGGVGTVNKRWDKGYFNSLNAANSIEATGDVNVGGKVTAGSIDVGGKVTAGSIDVGGKVTAGSIDVGGKVTAGSIDVGDFTSTNTTLLEYGITDAVKSINNRLPDSNGNVDLTLPENNDFIGMRIEGGGTIFFDYALGYKYGSLSVAPVTTNLHSYHVDKDRNIVVCDDPNDTSKKARFYVVSDYDIGDYKHGNNLMWADTGASHLYNVNVGTSTAFGTGYANTEKCIAAANTDNRLEWNTNAYNCIWHYIWKGDWNARNPKWFVPSKDELNVLLNMQWQEADRRKSYDGKITFKQLPINFYSYYWSSSESSATVAHTAYFYGGSMDTDYKHDASLNHVRLVKTF